MAEDAPDPREGPGHPRHRGQVIGHAGAEAVFLKAFNSGRLHHAWLLAGPHGIGKATLAYRIARFVLDRGRMRSGTSLDCDPQSKTARLVASRGHPDLFVLETRWDPKTKKHKSEIAVDDTRGIHEFFAKTASGGGWRVAIVDSADSLNIESANALLKIVEEPPPDCLILLLSNRPGRLLRTIRSRCMRIDLSPLTEEEVRAVLLDLPGMEKRKAADLDSAIQLSGGSVGKALQLLDSSGAETFADFRRSLPLTDVAILQIAERFGRKSSRPEDFDIFCELLVSWAGREARRLSSEKRGARLAEAISEMNRSIRETNALNLDRRQSIVEALSNIDRALRAA